MLKKRKETPSTPSAPPYRGYTSPYMPCRRTRTAAAKEKGTINLKLFQCRLFQSFCLILDFLGLYLLADDKNHLAHTFTQQ